MRADGEGAPRHRAGDNAGRRLHGTVDVFYTSAPLASPAPRPASVAADAERRRWLTGEAESSAAPLAGLDEYDTSSIYMGGPPGQRDPARMTFGRDAMRWWREGLREVRRPVAVPGIVRFAGASTDVAATVFGQVRTAEEEASERLTSKHAFDKAAGRAVTRAPVLFSLEPVEQSEPLAISKPPTDFPAAFHSAHERAAIGLSSSVRWDPNALSEGTPFRPVARRADGRPGARALTDWPAFSGAAGLDSAKSAVERAAAARASGRASRALPPPPGSAQQSARAFRPISAPPPHEPADGGAARGGEWPAHAERRARLAPPLECAAGDVAPTDGRWLRHALLHAAKEAADAEATYHPARRGRLPPSSPSANATAAATSPTLPSRAASPSRRHEVLLRLVRATSAASSPLGAARAREATPTPPPPLPPPRSAHAAARDRRGGGGGGGGARGGYDVRPATAGGASCGAPRGLGASRALWASPRALAAAPASPSPGASTPATSGARLSPTAHLTPHAARPTPAPTHAALEPNAWTHLLARPLASPPGPMSVAARAAAERVAERRAAAVRSPPVVARSRATPPVGAGEPGDGDGLVAEGNDPLLPAAEPLVAFEARLNEARARLCGGVDFADGGAGRAGGKLGGLLASTFER